MIRKINVMHYLDVDGRYTCNKAVEPTKSKITHNIKDVTCKNCMKILKDRPKINKNHYLKQIKDNFELEEDDFELEDDFDLEDDEDNGFYFKNETREATMGKQYEPIMIGYPDIIKFKKHQLKELLRKLEMSGANEIGVPIKEVNSR